MNSVRWVALGVIVIVSGLFAYFNGAERVVLSFGFVTVYRASLVVVTFGAFILGMVAMFLLGLRHDMQVRRALRDRGLLERPPRPRHEEEVAHTDWRPPSYSEDFAAPEARDDRPR